MESSAQGWPAVCWIPGMSAVAFKVHKKNGDYVKPSLVPSESEVSRFSALDGILLAFFLLCVAGLVCLLLAK